MAKYPFDARFYLTVKNLPGHEGEVWDYLLNVPWFAQGPIFDGLDAAGYPAHTVAKIIDRLFKKSVSDLIELALGDDLESSPGLLVLQRLASREVFDSAVQLCQSKIAKDRALGVLILMRVPGLTHLNEAVEVVTAVADREADETVMAPLAYALRHLDVPNRSAFLRRAAKSKDPLTRFAVAFSLADLIDEIAIQTKIALSRDADEDVRDWATFNLHLGLDSERRNRKEIKDAFYARINDPHAETRYEAIVGLAMCKDARVLPLLIEALEQKDVWDLAIEAAREMGHPALLPALKGLRLWWRDSIRPDLLDYAIASCAQPARRR
jgi:hypothetical protein